MKVTILGSGVLIPYPKRGNSGYFLESEKKSVTAFTSPHLFDLRHRFWLKKKYISFR